MSLRTRIRNSIPDWMLRLYHSFLATVTAKLYRNPSRSLLVIGVTGTNGKSTVVQLIGHILRESGKVVAWQSTATERIADHEWLNTHKMTMPGRGYLQRFLRRARNAGCTHAVLEVSSQGIVQDRHVNIWFDVGVFTNITPEHIESHGSFEAYRDAKLAFFRYLSGRRTKKMGKLQERAIVINMDDERAPDFFSVRVEKYFGTTTRATKFPGYSKVFSAEHVVATTFPQTFSIGEINFALPMIGRFNIDNAVSAVAAASAVGVSLTDAARALENFPGVPGRQEILQQHPFSIMVDYAPEPVSMQKMYEDVIPLLSPKRIIHVFGSAGGGRDVSRRPILGRFVGTHADIAIVTNEDPYDEDPEKIISQIVSGVAEIGRLVMGKTLFRFRDRRLAIAHALQLAREGDLVVVTGKACEQWIMGPLGSKMPWDDRKVIQEELNRQVLSTEHVDK